MAAVDLFCVPDDRHRVVLLADLMARAGQPVELRCEPVSAPSQPCMIAWSRRALREDWAAALFAPGRSLVVLRLDDTRLPGPSTRSIDLRLWPARSADRQVGRLVDWLGVESAGGEGARSSAGRASKPATGRRRAVSGPPRPSRDDGGGWAAAALVLALVLGGGALLWLAATGEDARPAPGAERESPADRLSSGDHLDDDASAGMVSRRAPRPVRQGWSTAPPDEVLPLRTPGAGDDPFESTPDPTEPGHPLDRLCDARSPAAARVWGALLNWQEGERLPEAACVARLLSLSSPGGLRDPAIADRPTPGTPGAP